MRKENKRIGKIVIEEDYHRSPIQRVLHIICFIAPVAAAFLGFFIAPAIWNLFQSKKELTDIIPCPECVKFISSIFLFAVVIIIIFVKTRNTNPTMKIRVLDFINSKSE